MLQYYTSLGSHTGPVTGPRVTWYAHLLLPFAGYLAIFMVIPFTNYRGVVAVGLLFGLLKTIQCHNPRIKSYCRYVIIIMIIMKLYLPFSTVAAACKPLAYKCPSNACKTHNVILSKVPSQTLPNPNLTLNLIPHKSNQKWALVSEWLARSHYRFQHASTYHVK